MALPPGEVEGQEFQDMDLQWQKDREREFTEAIDRNGDGIATVEELRVREREMFYLTTHSTHFIYGYMVKDHSNSEKGNPLPPHRLLLSINSKGSFICTIPQTG